MPSNAHRTAFALLALVALALTALLVLPFAKGLFVAAVLAAALRGWADRLSRLLGGRRPLAAGLLTAALVAVVLAPLGTVAALLVKQVAGGVGWLRQALQSEGVAGLVARLPEFLQHVAGEVLAAVPQSADEIQAFVTAEVGKAATALGGVLSATTGALFQIAVFLVAFFFLLADGPDLVEWLKASLPLKRGQLAELLGDFRRVTVAVLLSTVATAGVQSAAALVGFLVARVPNPLFFAVGTFFLALVPLPLATLTVLGLAVLKLSTGHAAAGVFLAAWAVAVVGMVDNVVKPALMRGGMAIPGAVVFFALLGGIAAFGPVGLLAGPLIVAFLIAVARMYRRDYGGA